MLSWNHAATHSLHTCIFQEVLQGELSIQRRWIFSTVGLRLAGCITMRFGIRGNALIAVRVHWWIRNWYSPGSFICACQIMCGSRRNPIITWRDVSACPHKVQKGCPVHTGQSSYISYILRRETWKMHAVCFHGKKSHHESCSMYLWNAFLPYHNRERW